MSEIGIGDDESIAADKPVKPRVNAVRARAVVRVLKDYFGANIPDVCETQIQIVTAGKSDLVKLKPSSGLEAHTLFTGFHRLPAFTAQHVDDL